MSSYNSEIDFITRTKTLLKQYEQYDFKNSRAETYDVTLLLNCFVGLIVFPQQRYQYKNLATRADENWGIEEYISLIKGDRKELKEIVRHIRNSIAHGMILIISEDSTNITHVKFNDWGFCAKCKKSEHTFEAKIPIDSLRTFAIKFADAMLEAITIP